MIRLPLLLLVCMVTTTVIAQDWQTKTSTKTDYKVDTTKNGLDTTKIITTTHESKKYGIFSKKTKVDSITKKTIHKTDSSENVIKHISKFSIQLTLSRIDFGLAKFTDDGSFTLSPENHFLETEAWKTHNVGFEFFQMGYRFNHNFKVYVGAGADWTLMRLKKNITIMPDQPMLDTIQENIVFEKNRFSSTYLRIPLSFQIRTNDDVKGNKIYFVFGPEVGFLVNGKTKQISEERGKQKVKDDFNLNPFRYGGFARFGYDAFGLYIKYYNNDVFADGQGPKGFRNMSFGLMVGF